MGTVPFGTPRSFQYWNAAAASPSTVGDFYLDAGDYGLDIATGGFTNYQLFRLIPDGTRNNYAPVTGVVATSGYTVLQLPAGQYQMVTTGTTAFTGLLEKINAGRVAGR